MGSSLCHLPEADLPQVVPKVRVRTDEWGPLARALYERGIVAPTPELVKLRGEMVTNGLFGVWQTAGLPNA